MKLSLDFQDHQYGRWSAERLTSVIEIIRTKYIEYEATALVASSDAISYFSLSLKFEHSSHILTPFEYDNKKFIRIGSLLGMEIYCDPYLENYDVELIKIGENNKNE